MSLPQTEPHVSCSTATLVIPRHGHVPVPRLAPVAPPSWHAPSHGDPTSATGSRPSHGLRPSLTSRLGGHVPPTDTSRRVIPISQGLPAQFPNMIVPAGDLRPKAFGRIGLPCPSTSRPGDTQAPRDKNLSEPLEARTTASPSRLPWAVKAAEVTPCCPPPGDQWGSIPQGSSPLPHIQSHAISINTYS